MAIIVGFNLYSKANFGLEYISVPMLLGAHYREFHKTALDENLAAQAELESISS